MKKTRVYGDVTFKVIVNKYCVPGYKDNDTNSVILEKKHDEIILDISDWLPEGIDWKDEEKIKAWLKEKYELSIVKRYILYSARPLCKMADHNLEYKPVGIYGVPRIVSVEWEYLNHYIREVAE